MPSSRKRAPRPHRSCGRCGRVAAIAVRQARDGTHDLCFACYGKEPRRNCGVCGQLAAIQVRGRDGSPDVCRGCYRLPRARCSRCGRDRPCYYATSAAPVCDLCKPRRVARCAGCGEQRAIKARSAIGPLCGSCEWRRLRAKALCSRCGELRRPALHPGEEVLCGDCAGIAQTRICCDCAAEDITYDHGRCPRCSLAHRLAGLRTRGSPAAVAALEPYLRSLEQAPNALSVLQWLAKPSGQILRELVGGEIPLSHEALDDLDRGKSTDYLRSALVEAGVLPARDQALAILDRFATQRLAAIEPGEDHATVRAFATWKIARELAARRQHQPGPAPLATTMPKRWIACAVELTSWLHRAGLSLAELDQARLDSWLTEGPASRHSISRFIDWLNRRHGSDLVVPGRPRGTAVLAQPEADRLAILKRLLADEEIDQRLRLAGCLVALYAQPVARIVRLRARDLELSTESVRIRLGRDYLALPAALAPAAANLLERAIAEGGQQWLFGGLKRGTPTHPAYLAGRLKRLGIPIRGARSSALAALAHRIPAPVLADVLGLSAQTAAGASTSLKVDYAAYIARRTAVSVEGCTSPSEVS